LAQSDIPKYFM